MSDLLARICEGKRAEIAGAKAARASADIERAAREAPPPRGFIAALEASLEAGRYGLIAEIKRASPSRGLIRADFDPTALAAAYAGGGASCLSVLTDAPHFQGSDADLGAARAACELPVLRKDFMLDPYQIVESRALGADCVLLIMAALADAEAAELEAASHALGMDVLIEAHDRAELDRALRLRSRLIGINNRDLKSLSVDLSVTEELARLIPADRLLVSESGLYTPADLARMARVGARCFLVGESLMRQDDVAAATRSLLAMPRWGGSASA
jgi:indole-3-glycerol phosphate synthase